MSLYSKVPFSKGLTLVEVLVTVVILSILASVALPYGEMAVRRQKETELRRSLAMVRTAIDQFHEDWQKGLISELSGVASDDGYPVDLDVLVDGIQLTDNTTRKYLRRIPSDPFGDRSLPPEKQWVLLSYREPPGLSEFTGEDVYDIRSRSAQQAIDKTLYADW